MLRNTTTTHSNISPAKFFVRITFCNSIILNLFNLDDMTVAIHDCIPTLTQLQHLLLCPYTLPHSEWMCYAYITRSIHSINTHLLICQRCTFLYLFTTLRDNLPTNTLLINVFLLTYCFYMSIWYHNVFLCAAVCPAFKWHQNLCLKPCCCTPNALKQYSQITTSDQSYASTVNLKN